MIIDIATLRLLLKQFEFKKLFNQLGWDKFDQSFPVQVGPHIFNLQGVAQKRGVQIFVCSPDAAGKIPEHSLRRKIDMELSKLAQEHLLIFADTKQTTQVWQWLSREPGRTTTLRQQTYYASTSGDALLQKLDQITFPLSAEEGLTLTGVVRELRDAFDREKVTRKFYDRFKTEHDAFLKFIEHIPDAEFQRWYASVMINRLMFLYFIQGKGFLDNKAHYLQDKLEASHGHYYRDFLCPLFFDGLAKREGERDTDVKKMLGRVPYLNGGLFAKHQIEKRYGEKITIPNEAFERLYDFFKEFDWTLDERPIRSGKEINPDVLGYIFEKYINQKQMGAYYTKEDITEYIGKNTILPFLFNQARKDCRIAFEGDHKVWELLVANPDAYIYPSVRHGMDLPLPENIAQGVVSIAGRGDWNQPALPEYGLPTETWRETVARREHYTAVREKLSSGAVQDINDFVTLNLNIRQFALDALTTWEGADLIRAFWDAIRRITVLDPTCGSGAFLFAALEILKPLYEACLDRMGGFVADANQLGRANDHQGFRDTLSEVGKHPNRDYFVFKSIIVNNLYGVDIMEEATEICKLRLFLKLAAQVEPDQKKDNFGIEPLPDIDFNIRAGNTLVGFATEAQVKFAVLGREQLAMDMDDKWAVFEQRLKSTQRKFETFQELQNQLDLPSGLLTDAKDKLQFELGSLRDELDNHLANQYVKLSPEDKKAWRETALPFHWFVEFYKVMNAGGFDVIIGNPPYVEYSKVKNQYHVKNYITEDCSNLYAFAIERSYQLAQPVGTVGLIVPIALVSVSETQSLRSFLLARHNTYHFSNFAIRPAKLFEGVEQRLTILISSSSQLNQRRVWSSKYHQWYVEERSNLMANIKYGDVTGLSSAAQIPKLGDNQQVDIVAKVSSISQTAGTKLVSHSQAKLFFHRTPGYWIRMMDFEPYFKSPTANRSVHHIRELFVVDKDTGRFIGAIGSSSLFFFWFFGMGNCRNITLDDVKSFRIGSPTASLLSEVSQLYGQLMIDFKNKSSIQKRGVTEFQEFNWGASKPIIDQIDRILAKHYGFTAEEADFIINYDIKYRMGRGGEDADVGE